MMPSPLAAHGHETREWDAVVVGASLAGCSTAMLLARAGARVALVERQPDPAAFKRICGHFIHPSALPALERLELMDPLLTAGAARSRLSMWSPWGWIEQPPHTTLRPAINLRREVLDPLVRQVAAGTPGVELLLGQTVDGLVWKDAGFGGVELKARDGATTTLRSRLVVGADGRASKVAELAGLTGREVAHGRFSYAAYFDERGAGDAATAHVWMMDPQWGARFPTDGGLTLYGCMPTKDRLPEFKRDLAGALRSFMAGLPNPAPVEHAEMVSPVYGKVDMPNVSRGPIGPGLALVGDAALATDPLFGVGCGWAFEGAVRLADAIAPALLGDEPLERALARYRRRHRRALALHSWLIDDYSGGRRFTAFERGLFRAAAHDDRLAERFHVFGSRGIQPEQMLPSLPRTLAVNARYALRHRRGESARRRNDPAVSRSA